MQIILQLDMVIHAIEREPVAKAARRPRRATARRAVVSVPCCVGGVGPRCFIQFQPFIGVSCVVALMVLVGKPVPLDCASGRGNNRSNSWPAP